eukprot:4656146-Pleurochrysis_carterae.AAC.1
MYISREVNQNSEVVIALLLTNWRSSASGQKTSRMLWDRPQLGVRVARRDRHRKQDTARARARVLARARVRQPMMI